MAKSRRWVPLIGVLGLVAVATSIAAEFTKTKRDEVTYDYGGGCSLPQSPALGLGVAAAISLFLAQITANVMGRCVCCSKGNRRIFPATHKLIAIVFLILSWASFVVAMLLLIAGSMLNQKQHQWLDSECYVVKPGVFGGAALLSCSTTIFAIVYYAAAHGRESKDMDLVMTVETPVFKAKSEISSPSSPIPVAAVGIERSTAKAQESSWVSGGRG